MSIYDVRIQNVWDYNYDTNGGTSILYDNRGIDLRDAAAKLTPKSGAILATHLWGGGTDMDSLVRFADAHDLVLLEDAADLAVDLGGIEPLGRVLDARAEPRQRRLDAPLNLSCDGIRVRSLVMYKRV